MKDEFIYSILFDDKNPKKVTTGAYFEKDLDYAI